MDIHRVQQCSHRDSAPTYVSGRRASPGSHADLCEGADLAGDGFPPYDWREYCRWGLCDAAGRIEEMVCWDGTSWGGQLRRWSWGGVKVFLLNRY